MVGSMEFKLSSVNVLLDKISSKYKTIKNKDWNGENGILMRHDVDISLKKALRFARLEHSYNINSTYYVMTTSPTYNIFSKIERKYLNDICNLGFEVGLHFDPLVYGNEKLIKRAEDEANLIKEIIGNPIISISLHNPSLLTGENYGYGKRFKEAYPYMGGMWNDVDGYYFSDSRMKFPENIEKYLEESLNKPVQINLHPEHYSTTGESYDKIFSYVTLDYIDNIENTFNVNSKYNEVVGGKLVDFLGDLINERRSNSST